LSRSPTLTTRHRTSVPRQTLLLRILACCNEAWRGSMNLKTIINSASTCQQSVRKDNFIVS
jgi:hypothetical protein